MALTSNNNIVLQDILTSKYIVGFLEILYRHLACLAFLREFQTKERYMYLRLQILRITEGIVMCVNLNRHIKAMKDIRDFLSNLSRDARKPVFGVSDQV